MNFIAISKFVCKRQYIRYCQRQSEWPIGTTKYCLITARISTLIRALKSPTEIVIKTRRGPFKPYKYYLCI